jgi:LysR family hydrogen peroxide-inducible transcriptional activator
MPIDISAITLTELRYLVALAQTRHFGRAAELCHVTQPTLSAQIMKLERTLGVTLFERSTKGVRPTPVGEELAREAGTILEGTQRILELARDQHEPLSGTLRLGVIPTLAPYLLPWIVQPLAKRFPRLRLVYREIKTSEILLELEEHRIDCGVLALPAGAGLVSVGLFDEPFWLLVPREHALAGKKQVREQDLADETVLLLDEGHCFREQALSLCTENGARSEGGNGDFRATSIETLRQMVAAGMGTTLLPALSLGTEMRAVKAIPFANPAPARRLGLCWRGTHPRGGDHRLLAECIRANLPEGVRAVASRSRSAD